MIWALVVGCFAEFPTRDFPPSLVIEQPPEEYRSTDGSVYNENSSIPFVLQINDNDSNAQDLYIRVQSDINDMLFEGMPDSDGMVSIIDSSLEPGTHQITINVADEENLISSEFPLVINGLPSIPELEILPQNPTTEDHLTADVILIEDPEGDEVTLDFVWSLNGVEQEVTESALNASETSKDQRWSVRVTPRDAYGQGEAATASVMIEDSPPEIEIIEILSTDESGDLISVQTVYNDESLQCEAQAYDADGDVFTLLYSWFFYQDMWYELESGSSTFSPVPSIVQPGARLYCGVIDTEDEMGDIVYQVVDVLNRDPEISSVGIDSLAGRTIGSEVTCQAIVNDPDQSDVEIQYKWYNDGPAANAPSLGSGTLIVQEFAEESSLLLTTEIASKGDQVSCLVSAFDDHGGSAESSVSIEVDNTAPEINEDGVVVLPISPFTNDDITCSAVAEDVDGDAITYTYAWYLNGQSVNHSGSTLSAQTFGPFQANPTADQIRCDVTPIDSSGATGQMQRTTVTIQDSPPETTSVTIVNVEAETFTDSTIVAEAEGYDADGDDVQFRYRWHVNGALLPGLQEYNSLTGDYFNKDDVVYVEVRSYTEDVLSQTSTMGTALTSQSITIQNSLPPAPEIAFIAGDYTESTNTAQCVLVSPSVDPDGDSVNYTFEIEKNNQPVTYLTSTTYTNDTLHWMDTVTGDELSCFVLANDGESDSDVATTSTIVTECEYQDIYDVDVGFSDLGDIQNCWQGGSMTGAMFFSGIIDAPHTFYDENYEGDGLDILSYVGIDEDSPMIARNMSTVPVILAGATFLPDMLAVTPSKDGVFNDRHAYIRWKAPLDGTCDVFYELTGISLDGTTVEVVLYAMTQKRLRPASQLQSFGLYTTQLDVVNVLGYQTPYIFEGNLANNGVISVNVSAGDLIFLLQRNDSGAHLVYPNADEDWMSVTGAIACTFE